MKVASFRGPLFIVGMPRSGTKLLRALLNQHPLIRIPTMETDFLPYWINQWDTFGDLSLPDNFKAFYQRSCKLNYMKVARLDGRLIGCDEWYAACQSFDPAGVFKALIKHDVGIAVDDEVIWGDKTPSYIGKTALLKRVYPEAKIIHIVRDVRDFCISLNKAWNKNIYRAAQRWSDDVMTARINGGQHGDYLETKYESILDDAETELRRICEFLEIEYIPEMQDISRPCENTVGDAKGVSFIKKDNKSKYEKEMPLHVIREIESIARIALMEFDYPVDRNGPCKRIGKIKGMLYEIKDGITLIRRRKIKSITDILVNANRQ